MSSIPLAEQLRPQTVSEVAGQAHLLSRDGFLTRLIQDKKPLSLLLWGPPGCGKTTVARLYAQALDAHFLSFSPLLHGISDLKKVIEESRKHPLFNRQIILFVDEIHRFNKAQQDFLLPYVESGALTLIGATTENPSFEVIGPLQSRCHVYVLKGLSEDDLSHVIDQGVSVLKIKIDQAARKFLTTYASGDARKALNVLEAAAGLYKKITKDALVATLQSPYLRYDQAGDEHYDTISAFIKSMRAGQPDAALYYLARMVAAGEDPVFIARRMVIFASEDIGLAQPTALVVANAVFRAVETIGYPECQENLAHGAVYLALAKKDRSAYDAFMTALEDVKKYGNLEIPLHIRNAPTKLMKNLGYGEGYKKYDESSYLPVKLKGKLYLK